MTIPRWSLVFLLVLSLSLHDEVAANDLDARTRQTVVEALDGMLKSFDRDGDDRLDQAEREALEKAIVKRHGTKWLKPARAVLVEADSNGDGVLVEREWVGYMARVGKDVSADDLDPDIRASVVNTLEMLFESFDRNADNRLDRSERDALEKTIPKACGARWLGPARAVLDAADANGDGVLVEREWVEYTTPLGLAAPVSTPLVREDGVRAWRKCDPRANIGKSRPADDPFLIPFYTGGIQPTPQQVSYGDRHIPLARTGIILGKGIKVDDARVAVLTERIRRYGGNPQFVHDVGGDYDAFISVGKTTLAGRLPGMKQPPSRPQGYVIHCTRYRGQDVVAMQGSDYQGLLWAITSFNQLVHRRHNDIVARTAEVFDYPVTLKRGTICGNWFPHGPVAGAWFCTRFKLNMLCFGNLSDPRPTSQCNWRDEKPESIKKDIRDVGRYLTPLGIEWYVGERFVLFPCPPKEQLCCGSNKDFALAFKIAERVGQAGGGFALLFDDLRFPLHAQDKKRFGSAREADIYFVNRLHAALRKKHPGMKFLFCPPFYWGPESDHVYPESRDEYLYAIGKRLPKDIGIYWTGPRVRSGLITPRQVRWITERIGRKPTIWQNRFGMPHPDGRSYTTDPVTAWADWYYDGFLQDIDGYMLNGGSPAMATSLVALSDYLWNPRAYDAEASIREAVRKIVGPGSYPDLVEINRLFSYFDKFELRVTPAAVEQTDEIIEKLNELERAIDNVSSKRYSVTLNAWTGTTSEHIVNIRRWARKVIYNSHVHGRAK